MLEELRIQNFAIIDSLELSFADGLNVITGETGAGKSIIIDAVELLLGGKADPSFIRTGADRTFVEGVFALSATVRANLTPLLEHYALYDASAPDVVTLSREVRANGRSTARVNGIAVNLDVVEAVGETLVDVHGQSAHFSLFKPREHLDLLDRYAGLTEARGAIASLVNRLNDVRREINHLLEDEASLKRRADRLRHEVEEIDAAELVPAEEDELKAERTRLSNSEQLARLLGETLRLVSGDETGEQLSAFDQLQQATALLQKLTAVDSALTANYELIQAACSQVEELLYDLHKYADTVEYNPERLEEVEERLEVINTLRRRYGGSVEAVLAYADAARTELENIENSEERIAELREQEETLLRHIGELSSRISQMRADAATRLAENIVVELGDLRMARAQFEVAMSVSEDPTGCFVGERRLAFDHSGIDQVEFMMSANPGEPLRPLAKVASGGEAARIMLALKRVLTQADQTPVLIFDEIDQGIGGRVGTVVGEKLWGLTGEHQVLVVTHLAQLAGYADRHYRVIKQIDGGRTSTQVVPLADDERIDELAAMLGTTGESGRQSARELLSEAEGYKRAHTQPPTRPEQQQLF